MIKKSSIVIILITIIFILIGCNYNESDCENQNPTSNETIGDNLSNSCSNDDFICEKSLKYYSYDLLNEIIKSKFEFGYLWINNSYKKCDGKSSIVYPLNLPIDLVITNEKISFDIQFFKNNKLEIDRIYEKINYIEISNNTLFGISIDSNYVDSLNFNSINDYYIDINFNIKKIEFELVGTLFNLQSFCIYDNKYYSSNGDNISMQDFDFNLIETNNIRTGHSNSFQSTDDGYGYISGWDDNCIYEIDLDSLSINKVLLLPISKGYSTCALNKNAGEVYVFFREDYPTSIINYKMYTYNIFTNTIINEGATSFKLSVQQSCCYRNGLIYMLWGGSEKSNPNGLAMIDINCNLFAAIHFDSFINYEPEGIYVTEDDIIYVSFSNKEVYKIKYKQAS